MAKQSSQETKQSSRKGQGSPFEKLRTTGASAYRLYALIAFYARARTPLIDSEVVPVLRAHLPEVCGTYDYELVAYRLTPNQVHLVIGFKPVDTIADIVSNIKRSTAHRLFETIVGLEQRIGRRNFWAEGYFAETLSHNQILNLLKIWQLREKTEEQAIVEIVFGQSEPLNPRQMERLSDRLLPAERVVIRLLYGLEGEKAHSHEEVAECLSLKPDEVREIERDAIERMRALLREQYLARSGGKRYE